MEFFPSAFIGITIESIGNSFCKSYKGISYRFYRFVSAYKHQQCTLHEGFFLSRSLCGGSGRPASGLKSLDKSLVFYAIFLDEETFLQSGG